MASFRPRGAAVAGRKGGGPGMDAARRRRRVGPTDDWEQLELLCLWPEQRDYELIRPLVLFGSPAAERAGETGAASERTLQRRARRFGISTLRALRLFSRAPCTRIRRSWLSATCSAGDCVSVLVAMLIVSPIC